MTKPGAGPGSACYKATLPQSLLLRGRVLLHLLVTVRLDVVLRRLRVSGLYLCQAVFHQSLLVGLTRSCLLTAAGWWLLWGLWIGLLRQPDGCGAKRSQSEYCG